MTEEETEEERKLRLNRERQRRYLKKHRDRHYERVRRYKERTNYDENWYKDNREYKKAKEQLRRICRPDLCCMFMCQRQFPGLDASELKFDPETAEACEEIYQTKLRELREAFGRDLETGERLDAGDN